MTRQGKLQTKTKAVFVRTRRPVRALARLAGTEAAWVRSRRAGADVAVFHELLPPPSGGGHQFIRALSGELARRGLTVELNRISGRTPACLFNSFNFDFHRLRRFARHGCRMAHRVDGPIGVYRGFDDGTDRRILEINHELAEVTVFQSRFSLEKHRELGLELRNPVVIPNAVDPRIFFPPEARESLGGRKLRVIATSWSDNPNKGAGIFTWLDRNLDWSRHELTFVGRSGVPFDLLRRHDLYVAASRDDPCSNALLEALACGLPAAYLDSGGHPELVGDAGLAFASADELPAVLERLAEEVDERRRAIRLPSISEVADRFLALLEP